MDYTNPNLDLGQLSADFSRGGRLLIRDFFRADVADALASAHRQGLAHLCLQPDHVLRTSHGQLKVAGLAVDAASTFAS